MKSISVGVALVRFLGFCASLLLITACNLTDSRSDEAEMHQRATDDFQNIIDLIPPTENRELHQFFNQLIEDASSNLSNTKLIGRICMALDANGMDQAAQACYTETSKRFPEDSSWHYLRAIRLHKNGDLTNALVALAISIKLNPNDAASHVRMGNWLIESGRFEDANQAFVRGIELGAGPAAELGLAQTHLKLGENQAALDMLIEIANRTDHPVALRYLGQAWRAAGNEANARRYLAAATEAKSMWFDDPLIEEMRNYAKTTRKQLQEVQLLLNAGLLEKALVMLKRIENDGIVDFNVHYNYALAYSQSRRFQKASKHLQKAIELEPVHFPSHLLLAVMYQQEDDNINARKHLATVTRIFPKLQVAYQELGFVQLRMSDFEGALSSFEKAIELDSTTPNVHYYAGVILGDRGACHDALPHFENTLRLDPNHTKAALGKQTCQEATNTKLNDLNASHQSSSSSPTPH